MTGMCISGEPNSENRSVLRIRHVSACVPKRRWLSDIRSRGTVPLQLAVLGLSCRAVC